MATYYVANYGSNSNNGTTPATPWQTVQFALGSASGTNPGLVAGDTVWIAPGTYREVITSATLTGIAGNTIKIYGDPKFTQAWTAGSVGRVRLTNYLTDTVAPTASQTLAVIGDYVEIQDLCLDGLPASLVGINVPEQSCFFIRGGNNTVTRCSVQTSSPNRQNGLQIHFLAGKKTCMISQCTFISGLSIWITSAAQTNPFDLDATVRDCLIFSGNDYGIVMEGSSTSIVGLRAYNNTIINSTVAGIFFFAHSTTSATTTVLRNNFIYSSRGQGINSQTTITITQSNNSIIASTTIVNVSPATSNVNPCMFDFGTSRIQQFSTLPWFAPMSGSPVIGAGSATGAPTVDLYGNTWTSTPTIGAIESKVETPNSVYQPTERNSSVMSLAPGTTSRSLYLYLGAIGISYNTSGLTAFYTRSRSTSTSISLVNQTPTGGFISGGFCEVSNLNQPGLYRLDVPDAAFASGASSVTVGVRGATGTNGAFVDISLSNSQSVLDPTQTIGTTTVGDALNSANVGGVGRWSISGDLLYLYAADGSLTKKLRVKNLRIDV